MDFELGDVVLFKGFPTNITADISPIRHLFPEDGTEMTVVGFVKSFPEKRLLTVCRWLDNNNVKKDNNFSPETLVKNRKDTIEKQKMIDLDLHCEAVGNGLFKQVRVVHKIGEYIVDYIYKTIPQFDAILKKNYYKITLSLEFHNKQKDALSGKKRNDGLALFGYYVDEDYSDENRSYIMRGKKKTILHVVYISTLLNQNVTSKECANILYDMVSVLLKRWYKTMTKEMMERNKDGIDWKYIESF